MESIPGLLNVYKFALRLFCFVLTVHCTVLDVKFTIHSPVAQFTKKKKNREGAEAGVLDEPDSVKPVQRSSYTGPPGYIG